MARRAPVIDTDTTPRVGWADFLARFDWRQGEHVAAVGPTGQGKTTLVLDILWRRDWSVILATKPRDSTLSRLGRDGYVRVAAWPPPTADTQRVLLWPRWRGPGDTRSQSAALRHALMEMFREGSWCIFADDVQYLTDILGLRDVLTLLWLQARTLGISVVGASQRPVHVPREMWSQSTHLFLWGTADPDDLRSISGFGGIDTKRVRAIVATLPQHDVLYLNVRTRALAVTRVER